ncbi:uncharacterized protein [Oscarella lobularis]|uniref:uncharacterized protein isoform X2 n=1 Tax=Oscarella lobularis TaxID=121494 RepID=UPI0033144AE5
MILEITCPTQTMAAKTWFVFCSFIASAAALDNGLAKTPPMGWSSWNHFHRNINETLFYETAQAMIDSGMQAAGYKYVNFDGGWWKGHDTHTAVRNSSGYLQFDEKEFPKGMKALGDFYHSKGLLFGHYTDSGLHFCNGDKPASQGYEKQDAAQFISWGIDMLKLDACGSTVEAETVIKLWEGLLNMSKRPILFSNCHNGCMLQAGRQSWSSWCGEYTNMWRSSGDIGSSWDRVLKNLDTLVGNGDKGQPGRWNDPDFLEVGNDPLTDSQNRAHFSLWCVTSAPLIAGNDVRNMTKEVRDILTNKYAIQVNQEYAGNAGDRVSQNGSAEVWAKPLPETSGLAGAKAFGVVLFNRNGSQSIDFDFQFTALNMTSDTRCGVFDIWAQKSMPNAMGSIKRTVPVNDVAFLRLTECQVF